MKRTVLRCVPLAFALAGGSPLLAATVTVVVDPNANQRQINPMIYGANFIDWTGSGVPPYPVNRWGGNSTTRYNWRVDVHNTASDWFYMNVPDAATDPALLPNGSTADQFLASSISHGSRPLLTVPTIGYTPKATGLTVTDARGKRWGFSVAKYPTQTYTECVASGGASWCTADAGDGTCTSGASCNTTSHQITGNDPLDTSEAITSTFVTDWMAHIASQHGSSSSSFYALDNEPALWNSTHRDVHPTPLTYDELWSRTQTIAAAIKAQDANAKVTGPAEWGWCAYFDEAADAAVGPSCVNGSDRQAHGGTELLKWYLQQVCTYQQQHGVRLIDYLDIHYYPQGSCVAGLGCDASHDETPSVSAARLRALKELYDPTWTSESWIGASGEPPMQVIPRLRQWIAAACPGVGLAITEYRWGNDNGASSALAQGESLALFGREGVDIATRWIAPSHGSATEDAFRLFLDPTVFGVQRLSPQSVSATTTNVDQVGAYAIRSIGGQLFVLLFNHDTGTDVANVNFAVPVTGPATLFKFDPASVAPRINAAGTAAVSGDGLSLVGGVTLAPRTAMLAVVQISDVVFGDGFESGDSSRWH